MSTNDSSTPWVNTLLKALHKLPKWLRTTIILVMSLLVGILCTGIVGCGSVTRINVTSETPGQLQISVSQNRSDSTNTHVNVNPTINFPVYGKENASTSE